MKDKKHIMLISNKQYNLKGGLPVIVTKQNTRFDFSDGEDDGNSFNIIYLMPVNIFFPQNTIIFLKGNHILQQ